MDFNQFNGRAVAFLCPVEYASLPLTEFRGVKFADVDAFLENLPLWSEETSDPLAKLFTWPALQGVKQHLASVQDMHVGLAGKYLDSIAVLALLTEKYHRYYYDVVVWREGQSLDFRPCPANKVVKICMKRLN